MATQDQFRLDSRGERILNDLQIPDGGNYQQPAVPASLSVIEEMQRNGGWDEENHYYDSHDSKSMKMDAKEPFWKENPIMQ